MLLSTLFPLENITKNNDLNVEGLYFNASEVERGGAFFCLVGKDFDGHNFALTAEKRGAVCIVANKKTKSSLPHIIVADTRKALALAASRFYGEPQKKLQLIGITGTNGKTTTSYIVRSILLTAGKKVGLIGTNGIVIGKDKFPSDLTTPDPLDFYKTLKKMVDCGVEIVVMEVSAHALALCKTEGVVFSISAFTNFSQDHLDFFGDMSTYFSAKAMLFEKDKSKLCVLNSDDEWVRSLIKNRPNDTITFALDNPSDVFGINLEMSAFGLSYTINIFDEVEKIKFNLPGKFNAYNSMCAAAICAAIGIPIKTIVKGIFNLKKVDGRFNIINTTKSSVIIDFAHTDDGIKNILFSIREFVKGKIITVFGCGGDRDASKRPVMGEIVSENSDYTIITSDNPRTENPAEIIAQIAKGVCSKRMPLVEMVVDRKEAIRRAVELAKEDDIILLAGKGAEAYIEIGNEKIPYSDEKYVLELLNTLNL